MGPNATDSEWAWAAVRFGFTPDQWAALTPAQRALISKADETRSVEVAEMIASAVNNAIANAFRKKGQKAKPVYRKRGKEKKAGGGAMQRKMRDMQRKMDEKANRG